LKYLLRRDTIFATISVFLVVGILFYNPFNKYFFNPVKVTLSDFSLTDLAFSKFHETFLKDDRIIIINIDTARRRTIADILIKLNKDQPKLIGLDVLFGPQQDENDPYLKNAIGSIPRLVVSYKSFREKEGAIDTLVSNRIYPTDLLEGYVNFIGEDLGVIRYYKPFSQGRGKTLKSFSSAIIELADSSCYSKLVDRNNNVEWINYRRNDQGYYIITGSDLLNNKVEPNFIKDKIILVGYVNNSPSNIDDKHFTPLNEKLLGRSIPDMNGVIIHANILSMILDNKYISRSPGWMNVLIGMIIIWFHLAFLLKYYFRQHLWFHLTAKIVELGMGILLLYLSIKLLEFFNISIDFTVTLVAIVIAVDVLYFYEAASHWLHRKFAIKSIFNQSHNQ
jgi:CHASE2 domain-containing sensor protein